MEGDQFVDIHVRDAVAVRHHKALAVEIRTNSHQTTAGVRLVAGIDDRNFPRLGKIVVYGDLVAVG